MADESSPGIKGSVDPGWNDPPLFSYQARQSHGKGYSLNKRVAYCMDGKNEEKQNEKNVLAEKFPPTGPPPPTFLTNQKNDNNLPQTNETTPPDKKIELKSVLESFHSTLEEVYSDENEKEPSEIKRRFALMGKMWSDNKFPEEMQQKLYSISKALRENKFDDCDTLQRCIMVDHTSLCSTWMAAIRLLINSKRSLHQ